MMAQKSHQNTQAVATLTLWKATTNVRDTKTYQFPSVDKHKAQFSGLFS